MQARGPRANPAAPFGIRRDARLPQRRGEDDGTNPPWEARAAAIPSPKSNPCSPESLTLAAPEKSAALAATQAPCDNGGMSASTENESLTHLAEVLEQQPDIILAIAFGSLASGRERPESDLDIAVLADSPLGERRRSELIAMLARECGRPVDLVDLRTAGVPLRRSVLSGGRRLICRDNAAYAELLSRTATDSADFLPYRRRVMRQRRSAWTR